MTAKDRSRLLFKIRYAVRNPDRIAGYARRRGRDTWLRLQSRDHLSYYRAVMASDAARSHEGAVGSKTHDSWIKIGQMQFDYLIGHGLKPGDRMLEIGCGNLRAGHLFIDYLDAGNYYGIDISPDILLAATDTVAEYGLQAQAAAPDPGPGHEPGLPSRRPLHRGARAQRVLALPHRGHRRVPAHGRGGCMAPGGFFDFTFDRTEGAEHHVLHEDFYYRTETLIALAAKHGLQARFMDDWELLPHEQSKLRVTHGV